MSEREYIYEIITSDNDARYCAQLLAEEFCAHNPITLFDQITPEHFYEACSWPLMKEMYTENLSLLARQRSTGEIVAATIAGDLYLDHERKQLSDASNVSQSIAVGDLLDEMDNLFISRDFGQELKPNMVLHMTLGAVRAQHSGKGIASEMRKHICDHARDQRGFQYLLVQTNLCNGAERKILTNTFAFAMAIFILRIAF